LDYINAMSTETVQQPAPETPRLALWAAGLGVAALMAASGLLWWTQGSKVFLETLAAGLAWCF
jgi:fatty acid desaturase